MADPDVLDLRCAPWTYDEGIDPIGSAVQLDRLITVAVALPWPADVGDIPWIAELDVPAGTRIQTTVPEGAGADGTALLTAWERHGARYVGTDWRVPAAEVPDALAVVVAGGDPGVEAAPAPAEVLVCSHGTRDRCCGGPGTRLAVEAKAALEGWRVRRTSHLGGHRFAPTALVLPEGRVWAFLDVDTLAGIVERTMHPHDAREHYRGHAALDPWAQVVEAARLDEEGWAALDLDDLRADVTVGPDGDAAEVELHWDGPDGPGQRRGSVRVRRRYPVIQCGLPPEEAKKTAVELELA